MQLHHFDNRSVDVVYWLLRLNPPICLSVCCWTYFSSSPCLPGQTNIYPHYWPSAELFPKYLMLSLEMSDSKWSGNNSNNYKMFLWFSLNWNTNTQYGDDDDVDEDDSRDYTPHTTPSTWKYVF